MLLYEHFDSSGNIWETCASQVINIKDMKLQTKWKVGTVHWKLANGQETKGGSKKLKGD